MAKPRRRRRPAIAVGDLSFFSFQDIITCVTGILLLITLLMAASLTRRPPTLTAGATKTAEQAAELASAPVRAATLANEAVDVDAATARLARGLTALRDLADALPDAARSRDAAERFLERLPGALANADAKIDHARGALDAAKDRLDAAERATADARAAADAAKDQPADDRLAFLPGEQAEKPVLIEVSDDIRVGDLDDAGHPRLLARGAAADWRTTLAAGLKRCGAGPVTVVLMFHPSGIGLQAELINAIRGRGLSVGWDVVPGRSVFADANGEVPDGPP